MPLHDAKLLRSLHSLKVKSKSLRLDSQALWFSESISTCAGPEPPGLPLSNVLFFPRRYVAFELFSHTRHRPSLESILCFLNNIIFLEALKAACAMLIQTQSHEEYNPPSDC